MVQVAIMGFGTVGSGAYDILIENAEGISQNCGQPINVKRILDLRQFPGHPAEALVTANFEDILNDSEITIVAEAMGGTSPVYEFTKALLMAGKSVVTSNKEMVATYGTELIELAKKHGCKYLFEASVCAAIPIIHPLTQCLAANTITEIKGILNGTTNYILTNMQKNGESFDAVLKSAQAKGYAERDPASDVEGHDTCRKIAILAWLAFGEHGKNVSWTDIPTTGITQITLADLQKADEDGCVIKLIGHAKLENNKVTCKVEPMRIPKDSPLANIDGVYNAVLVTGNFTGDVMFYGQGAGKLATGSSIVGDIMRIVRK
ncbi:MAG: homoserine dehydrogenase [Defluviitaleaceae bacterium]|nr:homoserine dehydrogenase [Defluviitaleaceae bacterium]